MTLLDRFIQRQRLRRAAAWLPPGARVVDVGAHQGELFAYLGAKLGAGFGIEPLLGQPIQRPGYEVHPGYFPDVRPPDTGWDAVTALAVFEHIPAAAQAAFASGCAQVLRPGGRVVITVPSPAVDRILAVLRALRLIDGMSLEQHYGFVPADTLGIFKPPTFRLLHRQSFQFGLNHLFVFERL